MLVLKLRGCVPGSRALFLNAIKRKSEMSKKCRRNSDGKLLEIKNAMSYAKKMCSEHYLVHTCIKKNVNWEECNMQDNKNVAKKIIKTSI